MVRDPFWYIWVLTSISSHYEDGGQVSKKTWIFHLLILPATLRNIPQGNVPWRWEVEDESREEEEWGVMGDVECARDILQC